MRVFSFFSFRKPQPHRIGCVMPRFVETRPLHSDVFARLGACVRALVLGAGVLAAQAQLDGAGRQLVVCVVADCCGQHAGINDRAAEPAAGQDQIDRGPIVAAVVLPRGCSLVAVPEVCVGHKQAVVSAQLQAPFTVVVGCAGGALLGWGEVGIAGGSTSVQAPSSGRRRPHARAHRAGD